MKTKIAIADDTRMLRERIIQMLEELGYDIVISAEQGDDLLRQLSATRSLPDVCLLDMEMPGMNGCEAATALRRLYPSIKILGHSFDAANESVMRKAGAHGFIAKGATPEELSQKIDLLLRD